MERQALTVSELNNAIKKLFDSEELLANVAVRGELSNYKIYPSGHHYFTLKDSESSLKCVMFRSSADKLRFRPESGMGVTASGRISVYPRDGAYQLYCSSLMPEGMGDLQLAFEQLKAKLEAEGLFDRRYKKPLPRFPAKIAIITSSAGAAIHDMIRILGKRWPMSKILLLPVRVQGVEAPLEIAGAIKYANEFALADLIITGRGGGSIEDLWAFNDERVARAIFASEIPVISAVGHEPDVTIADYVADRRASTPSNAAELAVPDCEEIRDVLSKYNALSRQQMDRKLQLLQARLEAIRAKRVMRDASAHIDNRRIELDHYRDRLVSAQERQLSGKVRSYVKLAAALDAMSPLRVLSRGYSIATNAAGVTVRTINELCLGDKLDITLSDGEAACIVEGITAKGEKNG